MDFQTLYKQHPVAVVGIVGGVALAGAYTLSKRGAKAATYPVAPITGSGSGSGYGFGTGPEPNRDPCVGPLGFLNPGCHPPPMPDPGPYPNQECVGPLALFNPNCHPALPGICAPGYHQEGGPESPCVPDAPLPSRDTPQAPTPPGIGAGDWSYMKAFDTSKRDMQMRISPW